MNAAPPPRYWFPKPYADIVQRLRVASGFVLLVAFAWLSRPSMRSMSIGLPIGILGLMIRAWAAGHLAKDRELATSGPYAYVRNPLYVGTLVVALGIVIASRSVALFFIFGAAFALIYLPVIELEEQHLRDIFPSYSIYASRISRFVPVRKWTRSGRRFSWALYKRNQEYKALIGFLIAIAWLYYRHV
ncbi:MAG: isoprenylcysteine carboxylmethyltransferase family protein [Acidobacteriaceae bacterium]|nr:isoprenylcysteine carboxylmethyltransferase family protein [Acidobacteriaceae bacterium]